MSKRALMAESTLGGSARQVLVDFGYTPEVLANNLGLWSIDPDRLDAAVLSHGPLDHYGGFPGLFRAATGSRAA
jgi:7,8-dihydropterin-6-yl-methyl-4-(beta-D-ribofuranosyl)aminobenzene 5'-phosphate synthase